MINRSVSGVVCPVAGAHYPVAEYIFLLRCKALSREREELMEKMKKVMTGLDEVEEERNVAWILDLACRNESIARGVEKLWTARFVQK